MTEDEVKKEAGRGARSLIRRILTWLEAEAKAIGVDIAAEVRAILAKL